MLVLSNEEIERLLTIEECMAALEPMYRDVAEERVLFSPRVDNIAPNAHPDGYYAFKHMGGTWPREKVQALRINSDVVTHPLVAGKPRRVKQPLANGRWVGLVLLFSTETGALLAMFPDGVMQRLRVEAADVIAAATSSMVRVIEPRWLKPGMHVSCIKTQEVDAEVLQRCDRVVLSNRRQAKHYDNVMKDTPNVKAESARGWWNDGSVRVERFPDLADVLTERAPGRPSDREITCFM